MTFSPETVLKVSDLTSIIKEVLETSFLTITVEGELSNFRPSSTGHWYFSLKDRDAMISGVMFKGKTSGVQFRPADGQMVTVRGNLSVYAKRGTYQIICSSMKKSGEGDILAMLEERKRKLAAEGLFDESRKKPVPAFPAKVAVVTSPTGAAIKDILNVLGRRNSGADIVILPAPVQGETAAGEIADQIKRANMFNLGDVIITGRGGGSLEDLLPFSDEKVVRAIAESRIPVISAVGHEIDTSLSDLAADRRAPTPSAAAEIVSSSRDELESRIRSIRKSLEENMRSRIERVHLLLDRFTRENLEISFRQIIQPVMIRLDDAKEELLLSMKETVNSRKHRIELLKTELTTNSPMEILKKGYSVVTKYTGGRLITSSRQISETEELRIKFFKGSARVLVKEKSNEEL